MLKKGRVVYDNEYMRELFPETKQQKPGYDLYSSIFATQFIICIFQILFYTKMEGSEVTASDQLENNQFSGIMVLFLFVLIIFMLVDRIVYSTYSFKQPEQNLINKTTYTAVAKVSRSTDSFNDTEFSQSKFLNSLTTSKTAMTNKQVYQENLQTFPNPSHWKLNNFDAD
jgi:hypothetical protein